MYGEGLQILESISLDRKSAEKQKCKVMSSKSFIGESKRL